MLRRLSDSLFVSRTINRKGRWTRSCQSLKIPVKFQKRNSFFTGNTDTDVPTSVSLSALSQYLGSFSLLYCCDGGGKGHQERLIIPVVVSGTEDLSIRNQCHESPAVLIVKVRLIQSCLCLLLTEQVCMDEQTLDSKHAGIFQLQSSLFCSHSHSDRSPETSRAGMPFSCSLCFF